MKYTDARQLIKTGDALVFSTKGWRTFWDKLAQVVRIRRRTEWSHIGMAVVGQGRVWVLEATRHGVWPIPLTNKKQEFGWIPYKELSADDIERAYSIVGDEYGWGDAVEADSGKLVVGKNRKWQCSEAFMWWHGLTKQDCDPIPDAVVDYLLRGDRALRKVFME